MSKRKKRKPDLEFAVDELMVGSGIAGKTTANSKDMHDLLESAALAFLRSGIEWDLWVKLSVPSKAAFIKANETLRQERILQTTEIISTGIKEALQGFDPKEFGLDSIIRSAVAGIVAREDRRAEGV